MSPWLLIIIGVGVATFAQKPQAYMLLLADENFLCTKICIVTNTKFYFLSLNSATQLRFNFCRKYLGL